MNMLGKRFYDETAGAIQRQRLQLRSILTRRGSYRNAKNMKYNPNNFLNAALAGIGDGHNGGGPIWAIFDADAVAREKWDPTPPNVDVDAGFFFSADTLADLAREDRDEIPARADAAGGSWKRPSRATMASSMPAKDDDFGKPKPLYKIAKPPFYAAWATPALHDTRAGLRINGPVPGGGHERCRSFPASTAAANPPAASASTASPARSARATSPARMPMGRLKPDPFRSATSSLPGGVSPRSWCGVMENEPGSRSMSRNGTVYRVVLAIGMTVCGVAASAAVPEYNAVIVKTYPHDAGAFTEGLLYQDGSLYENTGLAGRSSIRKVELATGTVLRKRAIDPRYFGEGIVIWKDRLIELTWQDHIGFIYDVDSFRPVSQFHYAGEGWALTHDDHHLIMSDGSSDLRLLDPERLTEIGRIHVTCDGRPIHNVNELEWVKGEIYANVWLTSLIVRIDPATGAIRGVVDLTELTPPAVKGVADDVLNGIAYDAAGDRLFVTGKLWPVLYQITFDQRPTRTDACRDLP